MSYLEHLFVLISVTVGLGFTDLLQSAAWSHSYNYDEDGAYRPTTNTR